MDHREPALAALSARSGIALRTGIQGCPGAPKYSTSGTPGVAPLFEAGWQAVSTQPKSPHISTPCEISTRGSRPLLIGWCTVALPIACARCPAASALLR